MPARADSRYPDFVGIDSVVGGVRVHKSDGRLHLFHNLGDLEPGLGAMDHREHREAAIGEGLLDVAPEGLDHGVIRHPTSAHQEYHRRFVGFVRPTNVHRERRAPDFR